MNLTGARSFWRGVGIYAAFGCAAVLSLQHERAGASERGRGTAKVSVAAPGVQGLKWSPTAEVHLISDPAYPRYVALLKGSYSREHWQLVFTQKDSAMPPGVDPGSLKKGEFYWAVELPGPRTTVEILAVGPEGGTEKEKALIAFSEWKPLKPSAPSRRWSYSPSLGLTFLSYRQTQFEDFSDVSVIAKFSAAYDLVPGKWALAGNAFFTLFPLTTGVPDTSIRFLGLNLRAGYILPQVQQPWRVMLFGGFYYTSAFSSGTRFGYRNLKGPQLFPSFVRELSGGKSVTGYFKYSPVTDGFTVLSLGNREIALGGGYTWIHRNGHPISVLVDYADLRFSVDNASVQSSTVSVSGAYGF